jgi:hypothetical protein
MTPPPLLRDWRLALPEGHRTLHESTGARENGGDYQALRVRKNTDI